MDCFQADKYFHCQIAVMKRKKNKAEEWDGDCCWLLSVILTGLMERIAVTLTYHITPYFSHALFILEAGCDVLEKGENTFEEIGLTLKIRGILPNFHIWKVDSNLLKRCKVSIRLSFLLFTVKCTWWFAAWSDQDPVHWKWSVLTVASFPLQA